MGKLLAMIVVIAVWLGIVFGFYYGIFSIAKAVFNL